MRVKLTLVLLSASLFLAAVVVWAQEFSPGTPAQEKPIIITTPPRQMIEGTSEWQPLPLEQVALDDVDFPTSTNAASDSCSTAAILPLPGGDSTTINSFTEDSSDPVLSCMWGTPSRSQGYRTAWYKFTAPHNGRVHIDTFGSSYDTVLAIFEDISLDTNLDPCSDFSANLQMAACVDDSNGFTSSQTITVKKDTTYFIEVADWEAGAAAVKTLNITALMEPFSSQWTRVADLPQARSRHAVVTGGSNIFAIGGQTVLQGTPQISSRLDWFNTLTGQWQPLTNMPGTGYSNTTAVYLDGLNDNGRIYLPSGYTGGSAYDMTHWAYDIQAGFWLTRTAMSAAPFAWASAVAVTSPTPGYYVTGGLTSIDPPTSAAQVRSDMLFYAPDADVWLPAAPMNDARYAHTAALLNGKICVVGGLKFDDALQELVLLVDGECYTQGVGWSMIAAMNHPRYTAGSVVTPNGKWIVFGGRDGSGAVSETEIYDPLSNTWTVLDVSYDLGGTASLPARAWPRGGVAGSHMWAIGGNIVTDNLDQQPLFLVEKLFLPSVIQYFPLIFSNLNDANRPDDHFGAARLLTFNVPQARNFDSGTDFYDVFYFDLAALAPVTVRLTQIPAGSNYDVAVYDANKLLWGAGSNVGNLAEVVPLTLDAGRYYVVVERIPTGGGLNTADYRLIVEK